MKNDFAMTKNARKLFAGLEVLEKPIRGRIGMMLAFGPPGTGKTEFGMLCKREHNAVYVRNAKVNNERALLANLVGALGMAPEFRKFDLFNQVIDHLIDNSTMLIFDEIDYLCKGGMIEVIRDINDITNTPIVLMGMEHADRKLKRYRHLYDRLTSIVRLELFSEAEVAELADEIADIRLTPDAVRLIHQRGRGKLRMTLFWLSRAERIAKINKLDTIDGAHLASLQEVDHDSA